MAPPSEAGAGRPGRDGGVGADAFGSDEGAGGRPGIAAPGIAALPGGGGGGAGPVPAPLPGMPPADGIGPMRSRIIASALSRASCDWAWTWRWRGRSSVDVSPGGL